MSSHLLGLSAAARARSVRHDSNPSFRLVDSGSAAHGDPFSHPSGSSARAGCSFLSL